MLYTIPASFGALFAVEIITNAFIPQYNPSIALTFVAMKCKKFFYNVGNWLARIFDIDKWIECLEKFFQFLRRLFNTYIYKYLVEPIANVVTPIVEILISWTHIAIGFGKYVYDNTSITPVGVLCLGCIAGVILVEKYLGKSVPEITEIPSQ